MKLAVIGAGSTYTPELVSGLMRERERIGVGEIVLHDIDAEGAWIVDFTNPVGIVTRALLDAGHRAVGLCNVAINFQRQIAAHLGVAPDRVRVDQVGLNHLSWIRAVWLDDRDVLADVI